MGHVRGHTLPGTVGNPHEVHSKCMHKWQLTNLIRFTSKQAIPYQPAWIHCITRCLIVMGTSSHHSNGLEVSRKNRSIYLAQLWNRLPPIYLDQSLLTIKSTIHNYLWHHFNEHFDPTNPCTFHFCCPCTICHGSIHNSNFSA